MTAQDRSAKLEEAAGHVRRWAPLDTALQAVGIDPTITAEERARLEEAEREAIEEAIGYVREAAKTDPVCAAWLRRQGIPLDPETVRPDP